MVLKKGGRQLRKSMLGHEYSSGTHSEVTVAFGQQYTWPLKIMHSKNKGVGPVHLVRTTWPLKKSGRRAMPWCLGVGAAKLQP